MTKTQKIEHKREQARVRKQNQRARERQVASGTGGQGSGVKVPNLSGQLVSTAAQSPLTATFNDYVFRKIDGNFYEALREGVPIFDAAVRRLISLNGTIKIIGDNAALVQELEDFCLNVPVNDMQKGIHAFAENAANETFEQGFSISEFVANKKRDDIERLVVADSKQLFFRKNKTTGRIEPWFRTGTPTLLRYTMPATVIENLLTTRYGQTVSYNGVEEVRLTPDNKIYFSINNENQDPHGVSLFRSTEFGAQILITIQNSYKNVAERFGDPSFHVHYKGKANEGNLEARRKTIATDFNTIITAKREGKSGDLTTASGPDGDVVVTVIGHDGQVLTFDIPLRHLLEQFVGKFGLAAWMLGIYWSTTERMATLEVEMALADAKIRQFAMLPEYIRLFSNVLRLRGRTWKSVTTSLDKPGDWGIIFESPNLHDLVAQAQAGFLNAQADMMRRGVGGIPMATTQNSATIVPVSGASVEIGGIKYPVFQEAACSCGHDHSKFKIQNSNIESSILNLESDVKELTRPFPWPKLDALEAEYEARLKSDWQALQVKVFDILGLKVPEPDVKSAIRNPQSEIGKAFSFDDDQRAAILKALKDYFGIYSSDDPEDPVRWYYAQSYSLGLIMAANMVGKERPLLDILKNGEIYSELVTNGFQRVKDNATRVVKNEVMDQMENLMLQGANPRDVASKLSGIFGDQNSDWERLARTEMNGAAERAKLEEWKERGVDTGTAVEVPVHPRCRCSNTIKDDGRGNFRVVFSPAPDACPWCLSMQEGSKKIRNSECGLRNAE